MTAQARKETISSRVLAELRGAILRAEIAPGTKINLDLLRHRIQTSISPLREALARLTADGLVLFEDQRGFRVAPVSAAELDEIFTMRLLLEVAALREAVQSGGMDWETQIIRALHKLKRISRQDEPSNWLAAHDGFHHALIAGAGRPLQIGACLGLMDLSHRYHVLAGEVEGEGNDAAGHEALAEAALRRDAERAEGLLRGHLEAQKAALHAHFLALPEAGGAG